MPVLQGLAAVVTGASDGIGAAIAQRLASDGASVLAVDRAALSFDPSDHLGRIEYLCADLAAEDAPERVMARALTLFGSLDLLVNNAAIIGGDASIETFSADDLRTTFEVNVFAPFRLCRAAAPFLKRSKRGRIVNIGSVNSLMASRSGSSVYVASKHALAGLTKSLAAELGQYGVTSNCVLPGPTLTPMSAALGAGWREHYEVRVPVGRLLRPVDLAGAVSFLASDDAGMINGHCLAVDGGMLAVLA